MGIKLKSRELCDKIKTQLKNDVSLLKKSSIEPVLASLLIGNDGGSVFYTGIQKKKCDEVGIKYNLHSLPADITFEELQILVDKLNNDEKSYVFSEMFKFIVYSFIFSFLIGWVWMIFGMFVFIAITIYNDRIYDKKKKARIFFLGCCIMMLFKNYEVYGLFYVKANEFMTGIMNNVIVGIGISVLISVITSIAAYIGYKDDCESIAILKFIIWFIPDVVLTMMFLYPYIIVY